MRVFLGGTCNKSTWRDKLIRCLKIDYFNPFVEDWTEECMAEEIRQREACDFVLYVITPKMTGVYSIAEVVDDSNKRPKKTLFCFLVVDGLYERGEVPMDDRFTVGQIRSLSSVRAMVKSNGAYVFDDLDEVKDFLNSKI